MRPYSRRLLCVPAASLLALSLLALNQTTAWATQWKWVGPGGVVQYSDQPPPPSIPSRNILQHPEAQSATLPVRAASTASQAGAASSPKQSPPMTELEKKIAEKKKAEQAAQEDAKRLQQQAQAQQRQQNCLQAQRQLQVIDSGQRMMQIDAQGQRYFLDDAQRAAERSRVMALIAQYCR